LHFKLNYARSRWVIPYMEIVYSALELWIHTKYFYTLLWVLSSICRGAKIGQRSRSQHTWTEVRLMIAQVCMWRTTTNVCGASVNTLLAFFSHWGQSSLTKPDPYQSCWVSVRSH